MCVSLDNILMSVRVADLLAIVNLLDVVNT